ncbi:MAG TPA: LLM class flavin-dependent oxidoreductase [Longimicrobiales bacterium]|nr:LLM class flavin-dependent oxidoreductase [Longimicrobiales bacterium]
MKEHAGIRVFSTCAPSNKSDRATYLDQVVQVARWSESAGCEGILVYTDNGLVDPWLLAQVIVTSTAKISPLVAVQPVYMHPYTAAKMISTIGHLYGRRMWVNMVAGGFKNDLVALGDEAAHDHRYGRVVEYATIMRRLLESGGPVSFVGDFYRVSNLKMTPPLDPDLQPGITLSGSSEAGLAAARRLGAVAVQYPRPVCEYEQEQVPDDLDIGIRIGIVAREDGDEAWSIARERFPEDRSGQLAHQLAMKVSDSVWHRQLSELGQRAEGEDNPYWLLPFENYKTFCPYLVGTYDTVATEIARYRAVGYETFILDVPASPEELEHIGIVFGRASARTT